MIKSKYLKNTIKIGESTYKSILNVNDAFDDIEICFEYTLVLNDNVHVKITASCQRLKLFGIWTFLADSEKNVNKKVHRRIHLLIRQVKEKLIPAKTRDDYRTTDACDLIHKQHNNLSTSPHLSWRGSLYGPIYADRYLLMLNRDISVYIVPQYTYVKDLNEDPYFCMLLVMCEEKPELNTSYIESSKTPIDLNDKLHKIVDKIYNELKEPELIVEENIINKIDPLDCNVPNVCFSLLTDKNDDRYEKYKKQRLERGFDDTETWALDSTFMNFILPRLERWYEIAQKTIVIDEKHKKDIEAVIEGFKIYQKEQGYPLSVIQIKINAKELPDNIKKIKKKQAELNLPNSCFDDYEKAIKVEKAIKKFAKILPRLWW